MISTQAATQELKSVVLEARKLQALTSYDDESAQSLLAEQRACESEIEDEQHGEETAEQAERAAEQRGASGMSREGRRPCTSHVGHVRCGAWRSPTAWDK